MAGTPAATGGNDEPVDIRYDNARRRLEITWADGRESAYDYEFLRWHCPCAACAGEMGAPKTQRIHDQTSTTLERWMPDRIPTCVPVSNAISPSVFGGSPAALSSQACSLSP